MGLLNASLVSVYPANSLSFSVSAKIWGYYDHVFHDIYLNIVKIFYQHSFYNYSSHPVIEKFAAVGLYALEYLIILPFLVFFWFSIFSIFLRIYFECS